MGSLLTSLVAGFVTGETKQAVRQSLRAAIFYGLALLAAAIGMGFLLAAAFMEAAERYGHKHAAIGFGVGFLGLALLIVLSHLVLRNVRRRTAKRRRDDELTAVATAAAVAALPVLLKGRGALSLLAVPAAIVAYAIYRENSRPEKDPPAN